MKRPGVLISGRSIAFDKKLCDALEKMALVISNPDNRRIASILARRPIDLVIIEVLENSHREIEIIKEIKSRFPSVIILFIDGKENREVMIKAFSYGAKDAFRRPYQRELLVERVEVLLGGVQ